MEFPTNSVFQHTGSAGGKDNPEADSSGLGFPLEPGYVPGEICAGKDPASLKRGQIADAARYSALARPGIAADATRYTALARFWSTQSALAAPAALDIVLVPGDMEQSLKADADRWASLSEFYAALTQRGNNADAARYTAMVENLISLNN